MRRLIGLCLLFGLSFPLLSSATWQISDPYLQFSKNRVVNPRLGKTDYPTKYLNGARYTVDVSRGNLQTIVKFNAAKYHWRVFWKAPLNLPVLIKTRIVGATFPVAMNRLLAHYDVYAVYNRKTCSMTVFSKHGPYRK